VSACEQSSHMNERTSTKPRFCLGEEMRYDRRYTPSKSTSKLTQVFSLLPVLQQSFSPSVRQFLPPPATAITHPLPRMTALTSNLHRHLTLPPTILARHLTPAIATSANPRMVPKRAFHRDLAPSAATGTLHLAAFLAAAELAVL
jgi:hypothetical protein